MLTFIEKLHKKASKEENIDSASALKILSDDSLDTKALIMIASIPRRRHFKNLVQLHKINNLRNGYCQENCHYCVQRNDKKGQSLIERYTEKSEREVINEAKQAWESGAYRYCLVSSGRGVDRKKAKGYAFLIRKIKQHYPMQVCLSAGLLHDVKDASILAEAGLDRYNHNLNTSQNHYDNICSTHTYQDRLDTLGTLRKAGIEICSGLIVGLGESPRDLVEIAQELRKQKAVSIPVNFFLPVPGHAITQPNTEQLNTDYCLRILCLFRLLNPKAEIRLAAGRELYFASYQMEALAVANSLFIDGYLNVEGEALSKTITMIQEAGYEIESENAVVKQEIFLRQKTGTKPPPPPSISPPMNHRPINAKPGKISKPIHSTHLKIKKTKQLRPFFS